mmetsp:Transcript_93221/g.247612  ORF Transcript_93221/g.247612 Transcript_93221/m.247612 type:complete len:95 (-) Transcript_93221:58-342(-)|eukprot:CAMPEP_0171198554 /NCGR_PEP_ID=MMETSP0790-20130122/23001_1 /TAXON_ID=2925 /ORGANISM="Alexandrium catenella, Strain OF101" /LENGTH=94 /DNA_ID=CAMNT_0011663859 /DNA_START=72 /DNA_END=356 /DNA_ORIENTATION=-
MSGGGFYASLDASKGSENGAGEQAKAAGDAALPKSLKRKLGVLQYPDLESAGPSSCIWRVTARLRLEAQVSRMAARDDVGGAPSICCRKYPSEM